MLPTLVHAPGTPGGVRVVGTPLWLDPTCASGVTFVSHAGRVPLSRAAAPTWLCTERTAALAGLSGALLTPFRRAFALGQLRLELLPSGRMPGASSLGLEWGQGERQQRLLYASSLGPPGPAATLAEPAEVRPCHTLVVGCEVPPGALLPPADACAAAVLEFVGRSLDEGATPVLLCQPAGDAQVLAGWLAAAGHRLRVHRSIYELGKRHLGLGLEVPPAQPWRGTPRPTEVALWPRGLHGTLVLQRLRRTRVALCAPDAVPSPGGGLDGLSCDARLPLPTSADEEGLVHHLRVAGAEEVYLLGPHAAPLASRLLARRLAGLRRVLPLAVGSSRQLQLFA
jgi:hypothetical protein